MNFAPRYHSTEAQILSEQAQIELAKKDPARFEVLYNNYYEKILSFVYQRLDSKDTAFDITSQVFLKAMVSIAGYQHKGLPFSAWLYRIAVNELNLFFRSRAKERAINVTSGDLHNMIEELDENDPEENHAKLLNALALLPEDELQLIEMRYFEKRQFREIGEIINITENNAKVKVYRVIEKLKKLM